jgi:hypothetical protein
VQLLGKKAAIAPRWALNRLLSSIRVRGKAILCEGTKLVLPTAKWPLRVINTAMSPFLLWLVEDGDHFDPVLYNALFRRQLDEVLPKAVEEPGRQSLEKMRDFDWTRYILASLRNAGFTDPTDQEEKAHDIIVYLLISPGGLFKGYDPDLSGPLDARFKLSVQNAIRNLRRQYAVRQRYRPRMRSIGDEPGEMPAESIPARSDNRDVELIRDFRTLLRERGNRLLVAIFDKKLAGYSLRQLVRLPEFAAVGEWRIRKALEQLRSAVQSYARQSGDEAFLQRVTNALREQEPGRRQAESVASW